MLVLSYYLSNCITNERVHARISMWLSNDAHFYLVLQVSRVPIVSRHHNNSKITITNSLYMSYICPIYALYMPYICPIYALYMPYICPIYALYMPYICPIYAVVRTIV